MILRSGLFFPIKPAPEDQQVCLSEWAHTSTLSQHRKLTCSAGFFEYTGGDEAGQTPEGMINDFEYQDTY